MMRSDLSRALSVVADLATLTLLACCILLVLGCEKEPKRADVLKFLSCGEMPDDIALCLDVAGLTDAQISKCLQEDHLLMKGEIKKLRAQFAACASNPAPLTGGEPIKPAKCPWYKRGCHQLKPVVP